MWSAHIAGKNNSTTGRGLMLWVYQHCRDPPDSYHRDSRSHKELRSHYWLGGGQFVCASPAGIERMQRRTGKIIERKISEGRIREMRKMKERKEKGAGGDRKATKGSEGSQKKKIQQKDQGKMERGEKT